MCGCNDFFKDADIIFSYSRKQAIEDGVLVDVSKMAKEAGFNWPVAVTERLWSTYICPPENLEGYGQSESGRLWDVLFMLINQIRKYTRSKKPINDIMFYSVLFQMQPYKNPALVNLKAVVAGGDIGEPVITIMLTDED